LPEKMNFRVDYLAPHVSKKGKRKKGMANVFRKK